MNNTPLISVISPVYGASPLLRELIERISRSVSLITVDYEIILVEDHSPDQSWDIIREICSENEKVVGLRHSRNFGQQQALNCGLDYARGEWIITLDCDLQDPPEEIPNLYSKAQEGFDIVLASRANRKDDFFKMFFSKAFYLLLGYLTDTVQDPTIANFSLYHRKVVEALKSMNDYSRYYPTMVQWVGFRLTKLKFDHSERKDGKKSSYSFKRRLRLAMDTILSFSNKPLRLTVKLGLFILFMSSAAAIGLVVTYFFSEFKVSGWASIFLSVWFLSGIMVTITGMIGLYVGKIFETVKHRPNYIVEEIIDFRIITEKP